MSRHEVDLATLLYRAVQALEDGGTVCDDEAQELEHVLDAVHRLYFWGGTVIDADELNVYVLKEDAAFDRAYARQRQNERKRRQNEESGVIYTETDTGEYVPVLWTLTT